MENITKFDLFLEGRSSTFLGMKMDSKIDCYKIVSNQGDSLSETFLIPSSFDDAYGTYTKILVVKSTDKITIQEAGTYQFKDNAMYYTPQMKK